MADNNMKITDAGTITSMNGTDKVFVNSGDDLKQITLDNAVANSTPVKTLSSNLGIKSYIWKFDGGGNQYLNCWQYKADRDYLFIITTNTIFSTAQPNGIKILCNSGVGSDYISDSGAYTISKVESSDYNEVHTCAVVFVRNGATISIQEKLYSAGQFLGGLVYIQIPL